MGSQLVLRLNSSPHLSGLVNLYLFIKQLVMILCEGTCKLLSNFSILVEVEPAFSLFIIYIGAVPLKKTFLSIDNSKRDTDVKYLSLVNALYLKS